MGAKIHKTIRTNVGCHKQPPTPTHLKHEISKDTLNKMCAQQQWQGQVNRESTPTKVGFPPDKIEG